MSAHEQSKGATDEWYTPGHVFDALGETFDLDVAHPGRAVVGWVPAHQIITEKSLETPWHGFVWMNPPFGRRNGLYPWLDKFLGHGDGIALTPDRTSAPWWQEFSPHVGAILFVSPKLKFIRPDGSRGEQPGTGTTLMAMGGRGVAALHRAERAGLGLVFRR